MFALLLADGEGDIGKELRPAFDVLVLGTVLLVGALSFLPALALGPLMEFLQS